MGVNIGQRRWSGAFKQNLRDSRIAPTEVLAHAVADAGVGTLINASAVGYYGHTKDRVVDENDLAGTGFLAQLCEDWEAATRRPKDGGARVVLARTGLVLSPAGGAWGGCGLIPVGPGRPAGRRPSIHVVDQPEDEVRALLFAISHPSLSAR